MALTDIAPVSRTRLAWEVGIVLALSIGQSALYSVLSLIRSLTREAPLAEQTTALNPVRADAAIWDAIYRTFNVFFDLCLVALVIYLLWEPGRNALLRIGLDFRRFGRDTAIAIALLSAIGIPGLGLYAGSRLMGLTLEVQASDVDAAWWTIPLLMLSAARAGLLEEVILNGYLITRLRQLAWSPWQILLAVALLRGAYHLYQGPAMAIGNVVMGLAFGWLFLRTGRVMPLVVAHTLLDVVAFVGYPLAAPYLP
ncbi:CPBP family intramembrane glutamic endopeptidase [Microbacterium amylolyticum]|uniref:Membrane protease YdiL (CAAX protease family) n=1 Tax=Microbacterium amylolyticum TaxID=936337 RepID=A0ABS4ZKK8_9MICO|nr:CPBP family intramembrane glutamic endopeptidase [Microbacterium amylolyticum]MBP2437747.1 membrane protease YdiL (CAAX protease family) [Microbacterium amylolyticum]